MASLALFVCLSFSTVLLVRDIRRRSSVSVAVWLPTFMLLVFGSRPLSLWFGLGNGKEGDWVDQGFYFVVILGSLLVVALRRIQWKKLAAANTAILLFYVYLCLSVAWSGDPGGSFKRWFKVFGMVFVVLVMLTEKDPLESIRAVYVRCASVLIPLSIVFIRYYPTWGQSYSVSGQKMYTGVTTQKNSLGEMVMITGLFLVWDFLETHPKAGSALRIMKNWDRLGLLLLGLWLLRVSQSKTAFACLLLGVAMIVMRGWLSSVVVRKPVLAAALLVPGLLLLTEQLSMVMAPVVEALGRDLTFTGRTNIWQQIMADKTLNPLIGAGFFNYWGGEEGGAIREAMQTSVRSAHSGYLETYLDGGLIAIGLLFAFLWVRGRRVVESFRRSMRNAQPILSRYYQVGFTLLIVAIFYNLSESAFARLLPTWFAALMILIEYPALEGKYRKTGARPQEKVLPVAATPQWADSAVLEPDDSGNRARINQAFIE